MANRHGHESNLILINATVAEETRVAITTGLRLENVFVEGAGVNRNGNIYKGRITRVVPSLQAAFVDFGSEKHGFLPLKEIAPSYFRNGVVSEGQDLIVQVAKEERGNKGAALTTFITLAGCYLVLMPTDPEAGGISRRIVGEDRELMREYINGLNIPANMGLIIRTAGLGRAKKEIEWDLDILLRLWEAITQTAESRPAPFLIHQESDIVIRALRDYLRPDIHKILIDSRELYQRAEAYVSIIRKEFKTLIEFYDDKSVPMFTRYGIESQIESAFLRDVKLPSGGSIVIEETEAMVTIDVNSAKDTKGGNIEQTAFNTNREAAIEIARQLRLRDIGGLIAIDFIDMMSNENQQKIVDTFKEETTSDKARVQFNRISRFGILEVSRQRLRPSLNESSQIVCPQCHGQGSIRSVESLGLLLLRLIQQESLHDNVIGIHVQVPIEVSTFLINEKRHALLEMETHARIFIRVFPNQHMQTPQYRIDRVYDHQVNAGEMPPSFKQLEKIDPLALTERSSTASFSPNEPAIKQSVTQEKPGSTQKSNEGLLTRLWHKLSGQAVKEEAAELTLSSSTPPVEPVRERKSPQQHRARHPAQQGNGQYQRESGHRQYPQYPRQERSKNRSDQPDTKSSPQHVDVPPVPRAQEKTQDRSSTRSPSRQMQNEQGTARHTQGEQGTARHTQSEQGTARHTQGEQGTARRTQSEQGATRRTQGEQGAGHRQQTPRPPRQKMPDESTPITFTQPIESETKTELSPTEMQAVHMVPTSPVDLPLAPRFEAIPPAIAPAEPLQQRAPADLTKKTTNTPILTEQKALPQQKELPDQSMPNEPSALAEEFTQSEDYTEDRADERTKSKRYPRYHRNRYRNNHRRDHHRHENGTEADKRPPEMQHHDQE